MGTVSLTVSGKASVTGKEQGSGYLVQVPGTRYLVPGTVYLVPCTWYHVSMDISMDISPGTWYHVPGTMYLVPGTRYKVPATVAEGTGKR